MSPVHVRALGRNHSKLLIIQTKQRLAPILQSVGAGNSLDTPVIKVTSSERAGRRQSYRGDMRKKLSLQFGKLQGMMMFKDCRLGELIRESPLQLGKLEQF